VELAADVPSMPDEYARASLLLVPLWVGAGARVKILEALAARLPVVATALAANGLELEPERHFGTADTPEGLADEVASRLADPARLEALAAEGRALAESRWSVAAVAALQGRHLASVAATNRGVASASV